MVVPESSSAPFSSIGIVGLGLIGGSVALAVRAASPSVTVVGIDAAEVCTEALRRGVVTRTGLTVDALESCPLVVLAAPIHVNLRLLRTWPAELAGTLITDTGSTKRCMREAARARPDLRFIGGHPLGGSARGGLAHADGALFTKRTWVLTPDGEADTPDLASLQAFVAGLGASPLTMSADEHDRQLAYASHLPQLAASALMQTVGAHVGADGLAVAGPGLVDTTRLASSPADIWRDIAATNADHVADAIDALIQTLSALRDDLASGDRLERVFADAAAARAVLMAQRREHDAADASAPGLRSRDQ